jgi:hypothetical protein
VDELDVRSKMESVTIKSAKGRRSLIFSNRSGDYFDVELAGDAVSAKKRVWGYTDTDFLAGLFESIARDWKGWDGERQWAAIEGDLSISASSDKLGHIRLAVVIRNNDLEDDWQLDVPIFLDAGGLDNIASNVRRFITQ